MALGACRFDAAYRDIDPPESDACKDGDIRCSGSDLQACVKDGPFRRFETREACGARGLLCLSSLKGCAACTPGEARCEGQNVLRCRADGMGFSPEATCDATRGIACRAGVCTNLCEKAEKERSNVGCEYWAVDLDNAMVSASLNAAAQQFAVVVSNVEPDIHAHVVVEQDDAPVGSPPALRIVSEATITPKNLEVFRLGPREVDGSEDGTFNTGTGTALTRHAYRIRSSVPIVTYQFNPLENANVFSNDASELIPTAALNSPGVAYVVGSWPQTIAKSENPEQNFGQDLRAFLTIVGTSPNTSVTLHPSTEIVSGAPLPDGGTRGQVLSFTLQPFDVLNLETGSFNADFTGTRIEASGPVAVFTGSEASDAPFFSALRDRACCADHLEEQIPPIRTAGKTYALARMPNRSRVVAAAGGEIGAFDEPEYYRVIATRPGKTRITTTLPVGSFELDGEGGFRDLPAKQDFLLMASEPVLVTDVQASQEAAGVVRGLPGGDPSLVYVPPLEQWRSNYVFLTPDKYAFDFVVVVAPTGKAVYLDGSRLDPTTCETGPADGLTDAARGGKPPAYVVYRCQLSFPIIEPDKPVQDRIRPGTQNDGVHELQADAPVGVIVYGFDAFVSYAYAGGTDLREINLR